MSNYYIKRVTLRGSFAMPIGECWLVVSREALYLTPKRADFSLGKALHFGALGGLVGAAGAAIGEAALAASAGRVIRSAGPAAADDDGGVVSCTVGQLPAAVRNDPDWPLKSPDANVLVLKKGSVILKHPRFSNEVRLLFQGRTIKCEYAIFTAKKLFAFLKETGWEFG